jgi:hypothetical protein
MFDGIDQLNIRLLGLKGGTEHWKWIQWTLLRSNRVGLSLREIAVTLCALRNSNHPRMVTAGD